MKEERNTFSIPTEYKGITFRSRLEARWAIYFDEIGVNWFYEFEGFKLKNGQWYLPDFYLPEFGYIEIKPEGFITEEEENKCVELSKILPEKIVVGMFEGAPSTKQQKGWSRGNPYCDFVFCAYSVRKWGNIPYYGEFDWLMPYDTKTTEAILKANTYDFYGGGK